MYIHETWVGLHEITVRGRTIGSMVCMYLSICVYIHTYIIYLYLWAYIHIVCIHMYVYTNVHICDVR